MRVGYSLFLNVSCNIIKHYSTMLNFGMFPQDHCINNTVLLSQEIWTMNNLNNDNHKKGEGQCAMEDWKFNN